MKNDTREFGMPINDFLEEAFHVIKKHLYPILETPNNSKLPPEEFNSLYNQVYTFYYSIEPKKTNNKTPELKVKLNNGSCYKDFEILYNTLIFYLKNFYEIVKNDNLQKYFLKPLGFLLGNNQTRKACYNRDPLKSSDIDEVINLINQISSDQTLKMPEGIERNLIKKEKLDIKECEGTLYKGILYENGRSTKVILKVSQENEIEYLSQAQRCNNVIKLIGTISSDLGKEQWLIMPYLDIDFNDLLEQHFKKPTLNEKQIFDIFLGIVSAIFYLHSINIIHRDIKPENILISFPLENSENVKLGDFGYAVKETECVGDKGTPPYAAPEIYKEGSTYTNKIDIFSFGVVVWIASMQYVPLINSYTLSGLSDFFKGLIIKIENNKNINSPLKSLLFKCLKENPEKRSTIQEVKKIFDETPDIFNCLSSA